MRLCGAPKHSRGVAAVEFVIAAPLLILVMLAVAELGRAFVLYDTLSYSIRNSARFVSENVIEGDTRVISDKLIAEVQKPARNLAVYGNITITEDSIPKLPDGETMTVNVSKDGDYNVRVDAEYPCHAMMFDAVLPDFTMRVAVTMPAIS